MCLAIPGRIIDIDEAHKFATMDMMGNTGKVSVEMLKNVFPGDYVIVHAGCAIAKIDEEEAKATLELFKELAAE